MFDDRNVYVRIKEVTGCLGREDSRFGFVVIRISALIQSYQVTRCSNRSSYSIFLSWATFILADVYLRVQSFGVTRAKF